MNKTAFLQNVAEILEVPAQDITFDTPLTIDSMGVLGLIAMFDENFGLNIKAVDLRGKNTVNQLIELLGQNSLE